ncbi:MAG: cytochrome-c peroxidase [Sphingomonadales bacterium]|nr:MAG: cytochrome-c peroxidase [Sphingomonadales bacterium]TNF02390.1 MAG: cytochrome-c peroxidase [Sphingomonadales bacterium]
MRWRVAASGTIILLVGAMVSLAVAGEAGPSGWVWTLPKGVAPPPVPADNRMSAAKVALGRRLFYEADLSVDGTMSCATCHGQRSSFTDGSITHPGVHGDPGLRNVPTLVNVAWNRPLNWADPAVKTLEQQALVPIMGDDPVEMGMKGMETEIVRRLSANSCYRSLFRAAFPEEEGLISMAAVTRALAAYERTIISFDTPWDRSRAGGAPLPEEARRGEQVFRGKGGCVRCHGGINFTDNHLHPFATTARDAGAMRATGRAEDRNRFRTPGLRNVALTAPYLHDGSAATLDAAIMAHGGMIRQTQAERAAIIAFLDQLSDLAITRDPRFSVPPAECETGF